MNIAADGARADVLAALGEASAGPLAASARTERLSLDPAGQLQLEAGLWEPLLLVAPAADLEAAPMQVSARIGATELPPLHFAPWTEALSFLPLHRPQVGAARVSTAAEQLTFSATRGGAAVPPAALGGQLAVQLLCGSFGRLHVLLQAETVRLRRLLRQIGRARLLAGAEGAMLDALGRELAVPRLTERLSVQAGEIVTAAQREPDAEYSRRLALYRPLNMPTRRRIAEVLNTRHPAVAGRPAFEIIEQDNPLSIALRLVSVADTEALARDQRHNYQRWLRETRLIDPSTDTPPSRRLPQTRRANEDALRQRLRAALGFGGASRAMAPALARALDRALGVAAALGVPMPLNLLRAQQDDAGSRWELGLAAEIESPTTAALDALAAAALAADAALDAPPAVRGLVARLQQRLQARQALGGAVDGAAALPLWLEVTGLRTVYALAGDRLMLSHFSTQGLFIDGAADMGLVAARAAPFSAAMPASGDPAMHAALAHALAGGDDGWPAGDPPWTAVAPGALAATIGDLQLPAALSSDRLRMLGLASSFDVQGFRRTLAQYPSGLVALLTLEAGLATQLRAPADAAWQRLASLLQQLSRSGAAAAVLLALPANRLVLVVCSIALPLLATNLAARRTAGFVWRALPIHHAGASVSGSGTRVQFSGGKGLAALAVIGYARLGATDPFEYRVQPRADVALDITEYEFLMNALRHLTPAGVQVNTWALRRGHVVLDPALGPQPLPVHLNRAFRPYRRPRFAGVDSPPPLP